MISKDLTYKYQNCGFCVFPNYFNSGYESNCEKGKTLNIKTFLHYISNQHESIGNTLIYVVTLQLKS